MKLRLKLLQQLNQKIQVMVKTYKKYREDAGVGALEDQLNTLKEEQNILLANKKARITSEEVRLLLQMLFLEE